MMRRETLRCFTRAMKQRRVAYLPSRMRAHALLGLPKRSAKGWSRSRPIALILSGYAFSAYPAGTACGGLTPRCIKWMVHPFCCALFAFASATRAANTSRGSSALPLTLPSTFVGASSPRSCACRWLI
jgi:hypothetical protein